MPNKPTLNAPTASQLQGRSSQNLALRVLAAVAALALVLTGMTSSVAETEASWTASEYAGSREITAITVNPPTGLECDGWPRRSLTWNLPEDDPPAGGYRMEVTHDNTGESQELSIEDGGTTRLVLSSGLLGTLLDLLTQPRGWHTVRIQAVGPGGWTSDYDETESARFYVRPLGTVTCSPIIG